MMGTGTFAEPTLEALLTTSDPVVGVFTQPDRDTGIKRGSTRLSENRMKEIAQARSIPVLQPENINAPEGLEMLRQLQPDLLVVAAYGQILSNDLLSIPPHGAINVHASLLPKYRGAAPIAWAIYHGETHSGVTIIRISAGLDAGDMLAQESLEILPHETAGELEARLAPVGAAMALAVIERMRAGPVQGAKQDKALVTKAPKLKKENGLIDWSRTSEQVGRQVQAMQPWPMAYTFFKRSGKEPIRVIVSKVNRTDQSAGGRTPGAVFAHEKKLLVATGDGAAVEVVELHPAGKKKMLAEEFLRGYRLQPDDSFGGE
jgi:methionyl-tRNA formyltransferase